MEGWAAEERPEEARAALRAAGIPGGVVRRAVDLVRGRHRAAGGFWQMKERRYTGVHPQPSAAIRANGTPYAVNAAAPTLGEHNDTVLRDVLGLTKAEITALTRQGVIGTELVS